MVSFNRGWFNRSKFNQYAQDDRLGVAVFTITPTITAVPSRDIEDSAAFAVAVTLSAVPSRHTLGIAAFDISVTLAAAGILDIEDSAMFTVTPVISAVPSRDIQNSATFDVTVLFSAYASPHIFDGVLLGTPESAELVQTVEAEEIAPVLLVAVQPLTLETSTMSLVLEATELTQTAEVI